VLNNFQRQASSFLLALFFPLPNSMNLAREKPLFECTKGKTLVFPVAVHSHLFFNLRKGKNMYFSLLLQETHTETPYRKHMWARRTLQNFAKTSVTFAEFVKIKIHDLIFSIISGILIQAKKKQACLAQLVRASVSYAECH